MSWNLFHGRDFPPNPKLRSWRSRLLRSAERDDTHVQVNRSLFDEFAAVLAGRDWEVALLQEAPPRWLRPLAERLRATGHEALTSRNTGFALRGLAARLNPDLLASNEGGSNQTLVKAPARVHDVRRLTLTEEPERRRMLFLRAEVPGVGDLAVANLHATAGDHPAAAADIRNAADQASEWAEGAPMVFGGDLNLRPEQDRELFEWLHERHGLAPPTPKSIDHLLARGLEVVAAPTRLSPEAREVPGPDGLRIRLSDHAPVAAAFGMR